MSFMRTFSTWALRGLLAWGALEASASLYDEIGARSGAIEAIANQRAAAERLEARAASAEATARQLGARLRGRVQISWRPVAAQDQGAAADVLRQSLIDLGAQAPVVDATFAPAALGMAHIAFIARWREPMETSPSVLHALASRFPALSVERLTMTQRDGFIETEVRLDAIAPLLSSRTRS